jgi:hypothetical protein
MSADPALNDINDELVDYEEEEVPEGDAAKGDQVGKFFERRVALQLAASQPHHASNLRFVTIAAPSGGEVSPPSCHVGDS